MNVFDEFTSILISEFNNKNVEYIVFGGYAVNYHGYVRTTGDIDLWLKPDNENKLKVLAAFKKVEVEPEVLRHIAEMDFSVHFFFHDGERPYRIDFLNYVSGITFEEAWAQKEFSEIDGIQMPFLSFNHLILSKFNSTRPKDMLDIEELQKIAAAKKKYR